MVGRAERYAYGVLADLCYNIDLVSRRSGPAAGVDIRLIGRYSSGQYVMGSTAGIASGRNCKRAGSDDWSQNMIRLK